MRCLKFNFLKKSTFFLFIAFYLITSPAWSMKGEMEAETVSAIGGIEIPSEVENIGIRSYSYMIPEVERSWRYLNSYMDQTIENFKRGDQRGILLVHSLEDIMGALPSFLKKWNEAFPGDIRTVKGETFEVFSEEFHKLFSPEEFVHYYSDFVLAHRALISCSVVAINDLPHLSLRSTFSPVNFIMDAPEECIRVTSRGDAFTPVYYSSLMGPIDSHLEKTLEDYEISYAGYFEKESAERISLDAMLRYPKISFEANHDDGKYWNTMNEVAISSCSIKDDSSIVRPFIKGVLINTLAQSPGTDCGNSIRNQKWIEAARGYAIVNNLPLLEYSDTSKDTYGLDKVKAITSEWSEGIIDDPMVYARKIHSFGTKVEKTPKDTTFLFSDEQLKGYGLKRGF